MRPLWDWSFSEGKLAVTQTSHASWEAVLESHWRSRDSMRAWRWPAPGQGQGHLFWVKLCRLNEPSKACFLWPFLPVLTQLTIHENSSVLIIVPTSTCEKDGQRWDSPQMFDCTWEWMLDTQCPLQNIIICSKLRLYPTWVDRESDFYLVWNNPLFKS